MSHHNQRVFITAAAAGIGRVMAQAFVKAGANVFIGDNDAHALQATLSANPSMSGMVCDVSDEGQVAEFFKVGTATLGGLDIVVCNAGVAGPTAEVQDITLAQWRQCLAVNLDSAFLCAHLAAPL